MLEFEALTAGLRDTSDIKAVYEATFPPHERLPLWWLLRRVRLSGVELLRFYDGDEGGRCGGSDGDDGRSRDGDGGGGDGGRGGDGSCGGSDGDDGRGRGGDRGGDDGRSRDGDRRFVGFVYNVRVGDLVHVVFLAVSPDVQSQGYGSRMLAKLHDIYPGMRISLECEDAEQPAENSEERRRRRAFYIKNGYAPCGLKTDEGKVVYEMLSKGGSCTKQEHLAIFRYLYGSVLYTFFKPRFVE